MSNYSKSFIYNNLESSIYHQDILSDVPPEILTAYSSEDVCKSDYKKEIFSYNKSVNDSNTKPTKSVFHEEDIINPEDNFYFESDHLALKGNKDYRDLLKVIITLQAQRTQAIKDLDILLQAKKQALSNPITYVAKLQSGDLPEYPGPQEIPRLPEIDWSKYNIAQPDNNIRPQTRHGKNIPCLKDTKQDEESDKLLVRGRVYDDSKPETFNKLWTVDEQRRLEELLIEYPPEEIEMRRWTKIANALGNRTPKQVSSRVQKYFIKLTKAGLPIPGRGPKVKGDVRKSIRRYKNGHTFLRKSTFFPQEQILDEIKRESIPEESCYMCSEQPIQNIRWHGEECQEKISTCSNCAATQLDVEDPVHPIDNKFTDIRPPQYSQCHDTDYLAQNFSTTSYNYLDPNFLPK